MASNNNRRGGSRGNGNGGNPSDGKQDQDIPFRDADPATGEKPLEEIDTFLIPARDESGVSVHITLNIPPFMDRYIQIVLRSYRFPYLRSSDLIRHAVWRHLHWLTDIRVSLPKHPLAGMDAVLEICRDDEIRVRTEAAFERLNERIQTHYLKHDYGEAIRILSLVKSRIENVQPSPWKTKFLQELWRRHGHMLNITAESGVSVKSEDQLLNRTSEEGAHSQDDKTQTH